MSTSQSSHVNRLQAHALNIFSPGFEKDWFATHFDRGGVEKLQMLSGATMTHKGKKYLLLPPILSPDGSKSNKDVFLNPALARVSALLYQLFAT